MGFPKQEYWSVLPSPFARGSSWPRDWTQVSCIAGRFFSISATKEAHTGERAGTNKRVKELEGQEAGVRYKEETFGGKIIMQLTG